MRFCDPTISSWPPAGGFCRVESSGRAWLADALEVDFPQGHDWVKTIRPFSVYDQRMPVRFDPTRLNEVGRIEYIILDLFHTLLSVRDLKPQTHELLGVEYDVYTKALFGRASDRLTGAIDEPAGVIADLAQKSGSPVAAERYSLIADARIARFRRGLTSIRPAILQALDRLTRAGKTLALISNADVTEVAAWEESPLANYFAEVLISCRVGVAKPDPAIYRMCLDRLNATPGQAVFVGDGGSDEFAGARRCSIPTICTIEFLKEASPEVVDARRGSADYWIDSLSDLADAFDAAERV